MSHDHKRALQPEHGHNRRDNQIVHPSRVPNTPAAATSNAQLPSTSLRVHIQAECILASPLRS
jgi:hypothetical protein